MAKRKNPPDATQHDLQPLREHLARLDDQVSALEHRVILLERHLLKTNERPQDLIPVTLPQTNPFDS